MPYKKILEFTTAPSNLRTAYGAKLPTFDRAEILEDEAGDAVLHCHEGESVVDYRIEKDGTGGWVFFGGILLRKRD